jgi:hypothetical protein
MFLPQKIFAGSVLQITAEPGISIWLNNEIAGKTSKEEKGLVVTDLVPGEYVLKASKPGYDITEKLLNLKDNQTVEWRIKLSKPIMQVEDNVRRIESAMIQSKPTGTVIVKSIPLNAEVFFDGESIGSTDKKIKYVPAAEHAIKFVYQKRELSEKFSLQPDESIVLKADFTKEEIVRESVEIDSKLGPAVIKMQTARKRKPAQFPHRKHQEMFDCLNCHHGMDSEGKQIPYTDGMVIQHCVTCHNPKMKNNKLNSLMLAAHTRCKGCHKKVVAESGSAGPIAKCSGCHIFEKAK